MLLLTVLLLSVICGLGAEDKLIFYFDKDLEQFESDYSWDKALTHLENLFSGHPNIKILNSLIGFSWYYLIEGPIDSKKYNKDENILALDIWKKYLKIGLNNYNDNFTVCFIAGYTLLLHGVYIDEYSTNSRLIGINLLEKATGTNDFNLKELSNLILKLEKQKKYKPLKLKKETLDSLFDNDSLIEKYFKELYS